MGYHQPITLLILQLLVLIKHEECINVYVYNNINTRPVLRVLEKFLWASLKSSPNTCGRPSTIPCSYLSHATRKCDVINHVTIIVIEEKFEATMAEGLDSAMTELDGFMVDFYPLQHYIDELGTRLTQ